MQASFQRPSNESLGALHAERAQAMGFIVEETYWGYIVRSTARTPLILRALPGLAGLIGLGFAFLTLGLWLMPDAILHGPVAGMKLALSSLFTTAAAFFLWYASRGTQSEIEVDTRLAELREVVHNRAGRPTLLARYGFDAVSDLTVDPASRTGARSKSGALVVRDAMSSTQVRIASGSVEALDRLRNRLGRDLMVLGPSEHESPYDERGLLLRPA